MKGFIFSKKKPKKRKKPVFRLKPIGDTSMKVNIHKELNLSDKDR